METLLDLFHTFSGRGVATALVYRTGVRRFLYRYGDLHDLGLRMAGYLAAAGVKEGDRVLLWGPNGPGWAIAFWGTVARGGVVVPVDFMSGRDRAESIARLAEVSFVFQSRLKLECLDGFPSAFLEELETRLAETEPFTGRPGTGPADLAELVYTSGTTGNPKGVMLTHRNLVANLLQVDAHIPVVNDRFSFLSLLPLSHMFEQMGGFFVPLFHGATIVHLRTLKPSAIMASLAEEDIYAVIAVPRLLQLLKGSIEGELAAKGLAGLFDRLVQASPRLPQGARKVLFAPIKRKFGRHFTLFVSGGAPLSPEVFTFWDTLGFTVVEGYGLTECAPVLTANTMECQQAGAVGWSLPGIEIRIEGGEVVARGENIFPGYYRNEAATRESFTPDGWFRTGDVGEFLPDGTLRLKGRLKEMIVTGAGINVYPDELENILGRTAGVREACVIGIDRGSGDEVFAVIIPDGSGRPLEAIVGEVNGQLDELHRITGWGLWPEAEFPKTTTLKVRKFMVKERLRAERAGGEAQASADRLIGLVARITDSNLAEVREESFLVADLGLTSIGRLELVNAIELEYRLDLDDALIGPQSRVADLRRMIADRAKVALPRGLRFWTNSAPIVFLRRAADLLLHRLLFHLYVTLEVHGLERLNGLDEPVLFIANHTSYLDQPAVMFALPAESRYRTATAAWAEFFFQNFRSWPQRIWKRLTYEYGTLFLNLFPLPQSSGFRATLQHMGRLVDHGISILVFPEGERTRNGRMLPFRRGLGVMVQELAIPVVPVRIDGLERVLPRDAHWPRRGRVVVTFGEPIRFGGQAVDAIVEQSAAAVASLAEHR
ncbi:AMP-binding protein [Geobacter argillaceus]|uniref:Long-chain acyl-CoA synthetase n=1 Tax=Geobacter argillaceus TaxID=345631 RepID=A0A562VM28_9BACT|nr:AMP-binding protein [Geobacter argillaceus]TWJ18787.1 long-chain acyl-CoA synthetase [Geobacter argillaceus]